MSDPASFTDTSARHGLPYLFAGQAQKEFTVNEALARIDALLHPVVTGRLTSEPAAPAAGDCYIVLAPATDEFAGHEDRMASWDGQQWTFLDPAEGMMVRDASTGTQLVYTAGWLEAPSFADPAGGTTVDVEARDAITALADALRNFGIIS
ncbi:DUF2793 domain-containing protein [Qipengyuania sp. 1NDH17]|uniref:DUF2793 domain-containing protein n=1 Tax=Qipengyuania polymorpha TaxID=2867234 RepID=A0ABS7IZA1_9SPHN|nr:DUF2793 domain-containing protein [Qipengyuania polymorpha]MBX7458900.1 DUF2793 domain-containing protein [Qipengyuania polymorpha]